MMGIPVQYEAAALPNVSASWSNRNGGEILLIGGSVRTVMSAAYAQAIVDKLSAALAVPKRAADMSARAPVAEPERIPAPAPSIAEPLSDRRRALIATVPHLATRLSAVREAIGMAACEGAEVAVIAKIAFTVDELAAMADDMEKRPARRGDA